MSEVNIPWWCYILAAAISIPLALIEPESWYDLIKELYDTLRRTKI